MRIIDAHHHPDWHGHDLPKYLANMEQYGIEKTWLLNWECPEHEYSSGYREVVPAAVLGAATGPIPLCRGLVHKERAPERFVLGYCPDPRLLTPEGGGRDLRRQSLRRTQVPSVLPADGSPPHQWSASDAVEIALGLTFLFGFGWAAGS